MKKIIIGILMLISLAGHSQPQSEPCYNKEKDELVNYLLDQKPIYFNVLNSDWLKSKTYTLRYTDYEFKLVYEYPIDYQRKESWSWYCTRKDGKEIWLFQGWYCEDKIKKETLLRIREVCWAMEKAQNGKINK